MLHAFLDLADDGVGIVEVGRGREHDEELRVRRIRVLRARHADRTADEMLLGELRRQIRQAGTAGAGAPCIEAIVHVAELDVAGLRHEAFNHAMEGDVVVFAVADELLDSLDVLRCQVRAKRDNHIAVPKFEDQRIFRLRRDGAEDEARRKNCGRSQPGKQHGVTPCSLIRT